MPITQAQKTRIDAENRFGLAILALDAVGELCNEAANGQPNQGLSHVSGDKLACLIGILVAEMRHVEAALDHARQIEA